MVMVSTVGTHAEDLVLCMHNNVIYFVTVEMMLPYESSVKGHVIVTEL